MKVFLIAFTLMIVLYFKEKGLSVESALSFINWPVLQMIPVVGWQIAVYRLVLLGPTTLNVICTVIYSVFTVFIVAAAFRRLQQKEQERFFTGNFWNIRKKNILFSRK